MSKFLNIIKTKKIEIVITLLFLIISFSIRYINYASIPAPRKDEIKEDLLALKILQGQYPLTNTVTFIGAFYQYTLAIFYIIFGSVTDTARLMSVFFGTFTVALTYILAKQLYGRITGILSATLLATSVAHIIIASHVGWSASLTPFFGTLTVFTFNEALNRRKNTLFFATGLVSGITLQTHPSSVFLLIGIGIYLLLYFYKHSFTIKLMAFVLISATFGFALGYLNMIYFNIVNPLGSFTSAQNAGWTGISTLSPGVYLDRVIKLSIEYLRITGDYMKEYARVVVILSNVKPLLFMVLTTLSGLYLLKRRRDADQLLLILVGAAWLILPIGIRGFSYPNTWGGHYFMILLPISYIIISAPLGMLIETTNKKDKKGLLTTTIILLIYLYSVTTSMLTLFGPNGILG